MKLLFTQPGSKSMSSILRYSLESTVVVAYLSLELRTSRSPAAPVRKPLARFQKYRPSAIHKAFEARASSHSGSVGALVVAAVAQLHHVPANARPRRGSSALSCRSPTMAHLAIVVSETTLSVAIHHMAHCLWRRYS